MLKHEPSDSKLFPKDRGFLEILKEVAKEDQIYLHQLMIEVESEEV